MNYFTEIISPIGKLYATSDGDAITGLYIENQKYFPDLSSYEKNNTLKIFDDLERWLNKYFSGQVSDLNINLNPNGSEFRNAVWNILLKIPYGKVITYADIAKELELTSNGKKVSAQAVGGAVGHNPISILIPCHRVVGYNGNLTGYAGGIDNKIYLLKLEKIDMSKMYTINDNGKNYIQL
jgi:methylated-DNA-[protein]-cysteine S-methyltransferase